MFMLSLSNCWTLLLQADVEDQSKPQETLENSPTCLESLVLPSKAVLGIVLHLFVCVVLHIKMKFFVLIILACISGTSQWKTLFQSHIVEQHKS